MTTVESEVNADAYAEQTLPSAGKTKSEKIADWSKGVMAEKMKDERPLPK
jgi:hypothetical protein